VGTLSLVIRLGTFITLGFARIGFFLAAWSIAYVTDTAKRLDDIELRGATRA
jgi:hypothetical protein